MTSEPSPYAVLDEIAGHLRGDDLARLVHTAAFAAADERRPRLEDGLTELVDRAGLSPTDGDTRYGNVIRALEQGTGAGVGSATRVLLATLLARGVALSPPEGEEAEGRIAETLVWLATYAALDALPALDGAMADRAQGLWKAIGALIRRADEGALPHLGRAGALVAAAALRGSSSPVARAETAALVDEVRDPVLRSLLRDASAAAKRSSRASMTGGDERVEPEDTDAPEDAPGEDADARRSSLASARLDGELVPAPRGPVPLVLLAVTGILLVQQLARLAGRFLLRYRRPAALEVSAKGVTVWTRTELFGRTIKEQETYIPVEALLRATREVRYPRLGLYAGLIALGAGTYLGVSLFVDGARAGSPELLGMGALVFALGAALEFGLSHLAAGSRGRCRVVLVPRKGPALALGGLDRALADVAIGKLARA